MWEIVLIVNAVSAIKNHRISYKIHLQIHRISYKNSPDLFFNNYWIWFEFTKNIIDLRDSWCSEIRSWRHEESERFESCTEVSFCKNTENAVKISNSPHSPQKDVGNTL